MSRPLVVLGDALLDRDLTGRADRLSPDAPVPVVSGLSEVDRPGGAGLAALLAARDGADAVRFERRQGAWVVFARRAGEWVSYAPVHDAADIPRTLKDLT